MDRVTKTYLDAFAEEQQLTLSDPVMFEHFVDYCVVSDLFDDEFNVAEIHTGGGNDLGIDGIAIIANGVLVTSPEEVTDLVDLNGSLDVTFVFIQAKSGNSFSADEISAFCDGVDDFFAEDPKLPMNDDVVAARVVMQRIYDNSIKFRRFKPLCRLSFATTGQWQADHYIQTKINKRIEELEATGLFSKVVFTPMGADELHSSYQRSKNSVTTEFEFSDKVLLPEIAGVEVAYLGYVPAAEFMKLISDGSGNIRKSLFTDNVRDFQDYNEVNTAIQGTLRDESLKGRFVVLNNGVTLVARELKTVRNKITITDYQIVNGCQTSHVLFNEQENLTDQVQIPVRLIATQDDDVVSSIITATNRQTEVTAEDLFALGSLQKKLEEFLKAYGNKKSIYYERRSKQYNAVPGIEKVRIITKAQLIRTFAAMFLDDPHRASRYYKELHTQIGSTIFNQRHKLEPYYVSAYANYKLEFLFRNGTLPAYYKPGRYHLLMAFRYIVGGQTMPTLEQNKIQGYCNTMSERLWDDAKAAESFRNAIDAVDTAAGKASLTRDLVKTQSFTDSVRTALGVLPSRSPATNGNRS